MLKVLALIAAFGASAAHADWTAADKKCAAGVYCAERVVCVDSVDKPYPRGMSSDYYNNVVSVMTFKSVKNTANGKVLVDSLQVNGDPVGPVRPTLEEAKAKAEWRYGNYGAPMYQRGNRVFMGLSPTSNFSKGVNFRIISSRQTPEGRVDKLVGKEKVVGDVVGNLSHSSECEALVVESLSRIEDATTN